MNTQQRVSSLINSQIAKAEMNGQARPRRVLMDQAIWDSIVREDPHIFTSAYISPTPRFMDLAVIRTRDADGIVEVLP